MSRQDIASIPPATPAPRIQYPLPGSSYVLALSQLMENSSLPLPLCPVKNLPVMLETWVQSLGWENPLEKEMATHSSILAWRILRTEEPGGLQSIESQKSQTGLGDQTAKQCLALGDPVFHDTPDWTQPYPKSKEALGSKGRGDSRTRVTTDGVPAALCFLASPPSSAWNPACW